MPTPEANRGPSTTYWVIFLPISDIRHFIHPIGKKFSGQLYIGQKRIPLFFFFLSGVTKLQCIIFFGSNFNSAILKINIFICNFLSWQTKKYWAQICWNFLNILNRFWFISKTNLSFFTVYKKSAFFKKEKIMFLRKNTLKRDLYKINLIWFLLLKA